MVTTDMVAGKWLEFRLAAASFARSLERLFRLLVRLRCDLEQALMYAIDSLLCHPLNVVGEHTIEWTESMFQLLALSLHW